LCCDGSFNPNDGSGSHAWIFADPDGMVLWSGAGPDDGHPTLMSSYRTELGGLTAVLYLLSVVVKATSSAAGSATIFCDNKVALENIFDEFPKRGIYPLLQADYDLLGVARALLKDLPITVHPEWVKGHYTGDDRQVKHDLNDIADVMAGAFRKNPPHGFKTRFLPENQPSHSAILLHEGSAITSKIKSIVYSSMFAKKLQDTICKNAAWSDREFCKVNWAAHEAAFKSLTRFRRIAVAKLVHGLWNSGSQKILINATVDGTCPCCRQTEESLDHIYQCSAPSVVENREILLESLRSYMLSIQTPAQVVSSFVAGVDWWLNPMETSTRPVAPSAGSVRPFDMMLTDAFVDQTALGWNQAIRGRLSKKWTNTIAFHNKHQSQKLDMDRWAKLLIKKVWDISMKI
jgi:hypothetical protein